VSEVRSGWVSIIAVQALMLYPGMVHLGMVHPGMVHLGMVHPGIHPGMMVHLGMVHPRVVHPGMAHPGMVHPARDGSPSRQSDRTLRHVCTVDLPSSGAVLCIAT